MQDINDAYRNRRAVYLQRCGAEWSAIARFRLSLYLVNHNPLVDHKTAFSGVAIAQQRAAQCYKHARELMGLD